MAGSILRTFVRFVCGMVAAGAFSSTAGHAVAADLQAPVVQVTSPSSGATLKGVVAISASASDDVGVSRVEFYVNGALKGSDAAAPYSLNWDSKTVADGSVRLAAKAYDATGKSGSYTIAATVANGTVSGGGLTLTIGSSNASGVSIGVYPADAAGLSAGSSLFTRSYSANTRVWVSAPLRAGNNYFVKWQKDGADYDMASATSIAMDASHALTAVYQTPSCAGINVYPRTDSVEIAVATAPAGSTFCIQPGVHRFTSSVIARGSDKFIGLPGAILNGSTVLTSFTRVGSAWVASGATSQQPVGAASVCKADSPGCVYPEKAFLNSAELRQEVSLAALGPGEFYINYTTDQLYLYDDPTGKTVEVTTGSGGIVGFAGGENVTVKNLVFEKFGGGAVSGSGNNALKAVNGWRVENNEFRFIARVAVVNFGNGVVRNNYIHHNGQYGIMGGSRFEGNIIAFNNTDGFDPNNDAGASKFLRTVGLVVRGNRAYNNNGRGFWTDFDNLNTTYENNIIESNTEMGIFHEASCAAWIRNNVVRGNNSVNQGKSLWHGAQVYMRSSKDVEIAGNDISAAGAAGNAVSVRADLTYTGTNCGSIQTRNISVHDNIIRLGAGDMHGVVGVSAGYGLANNIKFNYNTYYLPDPLAAYFWYDATTKALTKDQWRNTYGQDWNGTFH